MNFELQQAIQIGDLAAKTLAAKENSGNAVYGRLSDFNVDPPHEVMNH